MVSIAEEQATEWLQHLIARLEAHGPLTSQELWWLIQKVQETSSERYESGEDAPTDVAFRESLLDKLMIQLEIVQLREKAAEQTQRN